MKLAACLVTPKSAGHLVALDLVSEGTRPQGSGIRDAHRICRLCSNLSIHYKPLPPPTTPPIILAFALMCSPLPTKEPYTFSAGFSTEPLHPASECFCEAHMPLPTPSLEAAGNNINSPALYRDKSFEDFVSENQRTGIDGCGNEAWYISHSALKQHWEESEIAKVLDSHQPPIAACSRTIAESYLRVWSILVFIGRPEFIDDFISANWDDVHLPMDPNGGPYRGVKTPAFTAVLEGFRQSQWPFFPVQFTKDRMMHKRKLDKRCVLPVVYDGTLTDHVAASTTTVVRKVQLQEDCTDFPHVRPNTSLQVGIRVRSAN